MHTIKTNHSHKLFNFLTGFLLVFCVSFYSNKAEATIATTIQPTCALASTTVTAQFGTSLGCTAAINVAGTTTLGTAPQVNCAGGTPKNVGWISFTTAATAQTYYIGATTTTATSQLQLKIWTACGGSLIGSCIDNVTGNSAQTEQVSLQCVTSSPSSSQLLINTTYYIEIINNGSAAGMATGICIESDATAGVACSSPTSLSATCNLGAALVQVISDYVTPGYDPTALSGCNPVLGAPVGSIVREHWYSYTISGSYNQVISVSANVSTGTSNLVVQIFSGTCGALTTIACANSTNTVSAQTETATSPSEPPGTYYIRILDYMTTWATPNLAKICVNTTCAAANALTLGTCRSGNGNIVANTSTANPSPNPTCATMTGEQWYTYTPAATGTNYTVTGSTYGGASLGDDVIIQILTGTCGSLTESSCTDIFPNSATGAQTEQISFSGTAGTPVYIRVVSTNAIVDDSLLSICINPTPGNNEPTCSSTYTLTANSANCTPVSGTVLGATYSAATASCVTPSYASNEDVWYSFTAAQAQQIINVAPNSAGMDPAFEVYYNASSPSTCAAVAASSLTLVASSCTNNVTAGNIETASLSGLTVGNVYWVRVYDAGTGVPTDPTFQICVVEPPPNDDCSGGILPAYTLSSAACTTGNITGATSSSVPTICNANGTPNDDIWYNITVPANSSKVITLTPSSSFNAVLEYYPSGASAICTNATFGNAAGCINGSGAAGPGVVSTGSIANATGSAVTYIVRVYNFGGGTPGTPTFQICVTDPPSNDNCAGATTLTPAADCTPVTGTITAANQNLNTCAGSSTGYSDVWYKFTTTSTSGQGYVIKVTGTGTFDPAFQVLTNCTTQLGANCINANSTAGGTETVTLYAGTGGTLAVSTTYYVRIYNATSGSSGTQFSVCITLPPLNDICATTVTGAGPISIPTPTGTCTLISSPANLDGATGTALAAGCGSGANNDVWYTFTQAALGSVSVTVNGLGFYQPAVQIFSASCGGTSQGCSAAGAANGSATVTLTLAAGTYWIRIYDASGVTTANSSFTFCATTNIPPPVNDICDSTHAVNVPITPNPNACTNVLGTVAYATNSETANSSCGTTTPNDVWYYFTAGATSETVTVTPSSGSTLQPVFEVFSGGCGTTNGATSLGCTAAASSGGTATATISGLTAGSYYWFRVYNTTTATPATPTFNVCVQQSAANAPTGCANAIPILCGSSISGTTNAATTAGTDCAGNRSANGTWYMMIGDGSVVTLNTCGSSFDSQINVYTGSCGALTCLSGVSNDDAASGTCTYAATLTFYFFTFPLGTATAYLGARTATFTTTIGTNYYIYVSGVNSTFASGTQFFGWGANPAIPKTGTYTLSAVGSPCKTPIIPLPIELVSFEGKAQGRKNLIQWATASETNNDFFTVEKSADAVNFEPLAKVAGAGNSSSIRNYSTYDNNPINGTTYYRLKQTDYNGAFTYSSVISVDNAWTDVNVTNVHPNPTTNNINFDFYTSLSGKVIVRIYDYMGRLVDEENQNVNEGNSSLQAKMENLSSGVYFLKVAFDKTGDIIVTKVVKN